MKRFFGNILIIMLLIVAYSLGSQAQGFELKPEVEQVTVEAGNVAETKVKLQNIEEIEDGVNTIIGYLKYDDDLIDSIEFTGNNNWNITFNNDKSSELYGKFAIITMQNGVKEDADVATIKFKLKSDLEKGQTEINLKDIVSSDGIKSINAEDTKILINIEPKKQDENQEENKAEENKNTENNKSSEDKKDTSIIPTGDKLFLYIGVIILVIVVNVVVFIIVKNKKKEQE